MKATTLALLIVAVAAGSGCARLGQSSNPTGGTLVGTAQPPVTAGETTNTTSNTGTANAISATAISGFVDPSAAKSLSRNELAEAASAQYYALQFGRPGAPRSWQGDTGATGRVSVGPYVRVNTLDCREFSHDVTISGRNYTRNGIACREADGSWDVADA